MMSNIRLNARWPVMARMFLISYAPLSVMFAARLAPSWWWTGGFAGLALVGLLDGWWLVAAHRSAASYQAVITKVEDQSNAVAGYLATYLLPFLGNLPAKPGDVVACAVYFFVAFVVFARSDLALINPTLYLFGWRVQRVVADARPVLLLSRRGCAEGDRITVRRIMGDVLIQH